MLETMLIKEEIQGLLDEGIYLIAACAYGKNGMNISTTTNFPQATPHNWKLSLAI